MKELELVLSVLWLVYATHSYKMQYNKIQYYKMQGRPGVE